MKEHVTTTETTGFRLEYFKTVEESVENEGQFLYGIYLAKFEGDTVLEQAETGPVTEDAEQIVKIITHLAENTVTPMVLCEVFDDIYPCFSL